MSHCNRQDPHAVRPMPCAWCNGARARSKGTAFAFISLSGFGVRDRRLLRQCRSFKLFPGGCRAGACVKARTRGFRIRPV